MEGLADQVGNRALPGSVKWISQKRMADGCHMYADLMSTACIQLEFAVGIVIEALENLIVGNGRLAVSFIDGHLLPVVGIPADRCIDGPAVIL